LGGKMKRCLFFSILISLSIFLYSCYANSVTGSIVVSNYSNKAANNLAIGDVYIGYVGIGQTVTSCFFIEKDSAKINAAGFDPSVITAAGTIDLKCNYIYRMTLNKNTGTTTYYYSIQGAKVSSDGSDSEVINYK
jgi:hypothetical protein